MKILNKFLILLILTLLFACNNSKQSGQDNGYQMPAKYKAELAADSAATAFFAGDSVVTSIPVFTRTEIRVTILVNRELIGNEEAEAGASVTAAVSNVLLPDSNGNSFEGIITVNVAGVPALP
ncbi:MAG: hypothetical protein FWE37_07220 [Spirochaetaceae bacterium]|nr:hypothetical protein [Spirochaetaceae bacterium]